MSTLDFSLIVVVVLNCYGMSVLLVLTAIGALIHPLAIIFTQPVKVDPKSALSVCHYSLRTLYVNRYFIIAIFDVGEGSSWVAVPIKIIVLLF